MNIVLQIILGYHCILMRASFSASTINTQQQLEPLQMSQMKEETKAQLEQLYRKARLECPTEQNSSFMYAMQTHFYNWHTRWISEQTEKRESYPLFEEEIYMPDKTDLMEKVNRHLHRQEDDAEQGAIQRQQEKMEKRDQFSLHQREQEERQPSTSKIKEEKNQGRLRKRQQSKEKLLKIEERKENQRELLEVQRQAQVKENLLIFMHDKMLPNQEAKFLENQSKLSYWENRVAQLVREVEELRSREAIYEMMARKSSKSSSFSKDKEKSSSSSDSQLRSVQKDQKDSSSSEQVSSSREIIKKQSLSCQNEQIVKKISYHEELMAKKLSEINQLSEKNHSYDPETALKIKSLKDGIKIHENKIKELSSKLN